MMNSITEQQVIFRDMIDEIPSTTYASFGLYNYPAKFIPQIIAYVIKNYTTTSMSIFDPFGGYGTVGVVSRIYGRNYELWDLNPMIGLLHEVAIMKLVKDVNVKEIIYNLKTSKKKFVPEWNNLEYWFPKEFLPLLIKTWGYYHNADTYTKKLLLIPLLKVTRYFSYNDNQRQKLSKSPYSQKRVKKLLDSDWQRKFYSMLEDNLNELIVKLKQYEEMKPKNVTYTVNAPVNITKQSLTKSHDILITSPPYLQAQEYIRNSKIDLFWLGFTPDEIKELSKKEIPYGEVDKIPIYSKTYYEYREKITKPHLLKMYDRYFYAVLGALTNLQSDVKSRMFLFVGSANVGGESIPIHQIFAEHFTAIGWKHEATLIDKIVAKRLFNYKVNPATGKSDNRMSKEHLVILKKK